MPRLTVVLIGDGDSAERERTLASVVGPDVEVAEEPDGDSAYLAFVPVGAEVAPGGPAALLGALESSGSDVAVGRGALAATGPRDPFARRRDRTDV